MVPETGVSGGDFIMGGLGLGGILWAAYEKFMRHRLQEANTDSGVAVATANEALFNMLTQRLTAVEEEVKQLRTALEREREYTRTLVAVMVAAGQTPPPYPALSH
jgi:hypothetical protein